jgi:Concanavalin A-like lectin/glucanases superfamily
MLIGIGIGIGFGGISVDLAAPVQAALSGTPGFALDPSDTATMWTDNAKTIQVAATNDAVAVMETKFGDTAREAIQASSTPRPRWNGSGAADYVTDDYLELNVSAGDLLNNKPSVFWSGRFVVDTLAQRADLCYVSGNSGTSARFLVRATTTGAVELQARPTDGGTLTTLTSAAGEIVTGQTYVITADVDFAGTRAMRVFKNGVSIASGTLTPAASNTSATNSVSFWLGRRDGLEYIDGRMGRMVFADKLMTAPEIAAIEAWVGQGAF